MNSHHECVMCYHFYATREELDHHVQDHMKVDCNDCGKKVRRDEVLVHKMNHMQLKSVGSKTVKSFKPVTGYGLWQKEERKKIVETYPEINFNEVSS